MGILGNEADDVVAKDVAVSRGDHEKWISGGGIRPWARRRKMEYV